MAESPKKALVEQLALQRAELTRNRAALQEELDPKHQFMQSLKAHPKRWALIGGGTAFLATRLLRSKKVVYADGTKKRGAILRTGGLLFALARPTLTAFAMKYAKEQLEARLGPLPGNSMLGGPPQK